MTLLDAAMAPSPSLPLPSKSAPTASQTKSFLSLSPDQLASLSLQVYRHTPSAPISNEVLKTFVDLCNASFTGDYHVKNFGGKLRYPTPQLFLDDLNHGPEGGWVFMLFTTDGKAVAGAKITLSGEGMDGGPGIHTVKNPDYTPTAPDDLPTFWLGALGSIAPGAGSILIAHIKTFLATHVVVDQPFKIRAYTVAEWGVNEGFKIPKHSPLPTWFQRQGFHILDYSWKPPGTWDSFYGGCLSAIEYVHSP